MNTLLFPDRLAQWAYESLLHLYPAAFREHFHEQMLQCLRDACVDSQLPRHALYSILVIDLSKSLIRENLAMLRDIYARPALLFNALVLSALATVLALGFYAVPQTLLRQGMNDPQIELSANLANALESRRSPAALFSSPAVDMASSLSPFAIAYDEHGNVLAFTGTLAGHVPTPPSGVLDYVRSHGEERLTWQPRQDVRIATVIRHLSTGGFVLAGRNMREGEARIDNIFLIAGGMWFAMLGVVIAGTLIYGWFTRATQPAAA